MNGFIFYTVLSLVLFSLGVASLYREAMDSRTTMGHRWAVWVSPWNIAETEKKQVIALNIGESTWVRSGGGCRYKWERMPSDPGWEHLRLVRLVDAKAGWVPCQQVEWWKSGTIVYDEKRDGTL